MKACGALGCLLLLALAFPQGSRMAPDLLAPWLGQWAVQFQSTNGGRSYRKDDGSAYCAIEPDRVVLLKWSKAKEIRSVAPLSSSRGLWIHFVSNRYAWRLSPDPASGLALLVVSEEPDGPETYRVLLSRLGGNAPSAAAQTPRSLSLDGIYLPKVERGVVAIEIRDGQIRMRYAEAGITHETPFRAFLLKDGFLTLAQEGEQSLRVRLAGPDALDVQLPPRIAGEYLRETQK